MNVELNRSEARNRELLKDVPDTRLAAAQVLGLAQVADKRLALEKDVASSRVRLVEALNHREFPPAERIARQIAACSALANEVLGSKINELSIAVPYEGIVTIVRTSGYGISIKVLDGTREKVFTIQDDGTILTTVSSLAQSINGEGEVLPVAAGAEAHHVLTNTLVELKKQNKVN